MPKRRLLIGWEDKLMQALKKAKTLSAKEVMRHWAKTAGNDDYNDEELDEYADDNLGGTVSIGEGEWSLESVPINLIEPHHDGDKETALAYAKYKKKTGSDFPPIILRDHPSMPGKFTTHDGVHRLLAAKHLGDTHINAYYAVLKNEQT